MAAPQRLWGFLYSCLNLCETTGNGHYGFLSTPLNKAIGRKVRNKTLALGVKYLQYMRQIIVILNFNQF